MKYWKFLKDRKEFTDKLLAFLINPLQRIGITPNMLSVASGVILVFCAYFINKGLILQAIIGIIISIILDLLDGGLARKKGVRKYGFLFDSFIDYCFDTLIIISFYSIGLINFETALLFIASVFFFVIAYTQYKLYKDKSPFILPVGLRYFFLLFLTYPYYTNIICMTVSIILLIESLILFNSA